MPSISVVHEAGRCAADSQLARVARMSEFQPISQFRLSWRWMSATHAVLPDDVLERIHPLAPWAARRDADRALVVCCVHADATFSASTRDVESTSGTLLALPVPRRTDIVVSWDEETAVETTWEVFCLYWPDFCYPGSDDVSIWSRHARWSLCYHHDETFSYRRGT